MNIEIQIIAKDEQNDDRIFGPGGLGAVGDGLGEAARAACSVQGGVAWMTAVPQRLGKRIQQKHRLLYVVVFNSLL